MRASLAMKLATLLVAQALSRPDEPALVCGESRVTFLELHSASDRIATALKQAGVMIGDRVAICLPNCSEFVAIFLAIVKCGGVALPINMHLSAAEIGLIFDDAEPVAVFFGDKERPVVSGIVEGTAIRRFTVGVEHHEGEIALSKALDCKSIPMAVPATHDDCVISYTSGTTGRPKGAIVTQANYIVANGFLNAIHWGLSQEDRILVTTPLAHRTAFARVGNMIILGCTLFVMPRFDAEEAARIIEQERISVISIVPTVGRMLLPLIEANPQRFSSLRLLVATGEAFPVDVKRRISAAIPALGIFSFFAMTEAGALTMLRPADQFEHGESVGRVTPGVEIRLVGNNQKDVPEGEAGEIWVRSGVPGQYLIFREYFRQPEATRDAFEDGWFKTGDIGRFDRDHYLHIVDRKKDMVLSGGYNIYSKEVELALIRHSSVADAAVIGVSDEVYGEAVAAFVQLESGASTSADELVKWCTSELAAYKKPRHVVFLDELPRTSTGKVTKDKLRKLFKSH